MVLQAVLIGSDIPDISQATLKAAITALDKYEVESDHYSSN